MAALEVAPNVGFFAGHSWVRRQVLGMANRDPSPAELEQMKALVEQCMQQGALGLSTGLLYVPANYAETAEIIELAKVAARYGGIYVSHMRDEGRGLINSVAETIRIAAEAGIPAQINHYFRVVPSDRRYDGKTLADLARDRRMPNTTRTGIQLVIELQISQLRLVPPCAGALRARAEGHRTRGSDQEDDLDARRSDRPAGAARLLRDETRAAHPCLRVRRALQDGGIRAVGRLTRLPPFSARP